MQRRGGLAVFVLYLAMAVPALADRPFPSGQPYGPDGAADWVRTQIAAGKVADFNQRCQTAKPVEPPDRCRTISAALIESLVLAGPTGGARRVDIANAIVEGDLNLLDADVQPEVSITHSRINGRVDLSRARFASRLSLESSEVVGLLDASGVHVAGDLRLEQTHMSTLKLNEAEISGPLSLVGAVVTGVIDMPNANIGVDLNLANARIQGMDPDGVGINGNGVRVGGKIYAKELQTKGQISFGDASTRGDVWFEGGEMGEVLLDSASIGSTLHMIRQAKFRDTFILKGASIDHYLDIDGASFDAGLNAEAVHVGQEAKVIAANVRGGFTLNNARLDGDLTIESTFDDFNGRGLAVRGSVDLSNSTFTESFRMDAARIGGGIVANGTEWRKLVDLRLIRVGQDLDLSGATLADLDLSSAVLDGLLLFSAGDKGARTCWSSTKPKAGVCAPKSDASVRLLNARAGAVQAVLASWPPTVELTGFTYARINMRDPPLRENHIDIKDWDDLLRRPTTFNTQHYQQLASAMAADGDRETAQDIQYMSRERERESACQARRVYTCGLLTSLSWIAGYGIGDYTWRAVYWVIGLTLVGAVCVLLTRRPLQPVIRNAFWALGASLERLLPYIHLDHDFTNFFEKQEGFRLWHKLVFGALALMGSVLGLFLAAAASGLTQKG